MRPVAFGEALAAGTRLTVFSNDKPDRFFTVINPANAGAIPARRSIPILHCSDFEDEDDEEYEDEAPSSGSPSFGWTKRQSRSHLKQASPPTKSKRRKIRTAGYASGHYPSSCPLHPSRPAAYGQSVDPDHQGPLPARNRSSLSEYASRSSL